MLSATYLHINVIILPITATITSPCPLKHVIAYKMFPYSLPYWTCISQKRAKSRLGIRISNFADGKTEVEGSEALFLLPDQRLPDFIAPAPSVWSPVGISSTRKPQTVILPEVSRTKTPPRPIGPSLSCYPLPSHPFSSASIPGWHSKPDWGLGMLLTSLRVKMYIPETAA